MAEAKTKPTTQDPRDFIKTLDEKKQADSLQLLKMFEEATGEKAVMWGSAIIGFGSYLLRPGEKDEAAWPLSGFSPRKQNFTLYIMQGNEGSTALLDKLGKYTTSVACVYINKLADVDQEVLKQLIKIAYENGKEKYGFVS